LKHAGKRLGLEPIFRARKYTIKIASKWPAKVYYFLPSPYILYVYF